MVYFFLSWCYFLFRLDFAIMSSGIYVLFDALFTDLNNVAVYIPKWINMRYATRHARLAVNKSNMGNCQHLYDRWYKIELDYQARQVAPSSSPSRLPQLRPSRLHCPEWGTRVKIFKVNLNMLVIRFVIITLQAILGAVWKKVKLEEGLTTPIWLGKSKP